MTVRGFMKMTYPRSARFERRLLTTAGLYGGGMVPANAPNPNRARKGGRGEMFNNYAGVAQVARRRARGAGPVNPPSPQL